MKLKDLLEGDLIDPKYETKSEPMPYKTSVLGTMIAGAKVALYLKDENDQRRYCFLISKKRTQKEQDELNTFNDKIKLAKKGLKR